MANAQVEKLKALGIRHGEKVAVGLLVVLCLVFVAQAATHETIQTTPDQVKKAATAANQNLNRPQKDQDILAKLAADNIKEAGFEKIVDTRLSTKQDATLFASDNSWVSPEPGAGLLREMPELIAVRDLNAHPGRGGLLVFERDDNGDLVYPKPGEEKKVARRPKRKSSGALGSMSGSGGGMGAPRKKSGALEKAKEEERIKRENERLKAGLAGKGADELAKADETKDEPTTQPKETTKGYRWVALTGLLDHKQLRENYAKALKVDFATAAPHYLRLDAERQLMNPDGTWPDEWEAVERDPSQKVLDDAAETEDELVPDEELLTGLVDYLPFLKVGGFYRGVHVAELVPKVKKTAKALPKRGGAGGGMMSGLPGGGSDSGGGGDSISMMSGPGGSMGPMGGSSGRGGDSAGMSGGMMGMSDMGSSSGGGVSGGAVAGGPADTEFDKTDAAKVMVRLLDFTVEPDATYRYRVRIVVRNPNLGWEMVAAGTDTKTEEKEGPWSDASDPVTVPPDVATYAMGEGRVPGSARDYVHFQVVRFNPKDGVTVVKNFDAAPGQIIGEPAPARVPKPNTTQEESRRIDFTSHQLVVDTTGGSESLASLNITGPALEDPARALVMRPDGTLVLRDQARDASDGEMKEMKDIYQEILDLIKAPKKKKRGAGGMSGSGMMGSGGR